MRWESGKPAFGFPLFHPPSSPELWECGNLAGCWRDFQVGSWEEWEAGFLAFHAFHSPGISTALSFAQASFVSSGLGAAGWLLWTRIFLLFTVLQSVAVSIHLQDVNMVRQAIQQRTGQTF